MGIVRGNNTVLDAKLKKKIARMIRKANKTYTIFCCLKFHQQLRIISFVFDTDENGNDYVTLSHETKQMNWQGGIDSSENLKEKRTYDQTAGDK
jgi:hypothetical protein